MLHKRICNFYLFLTAMFLCFNSSSALANATQIFNSSSFINPASMVTVTKNHFVIGVDIPNIYYNLNATISNVHGNIASNDTLIAPYFQFAHRLSKTVVIGFDVAQPVVDAVRWPANGFQKSLGIDAVAQGFELIPKISVNLCDDFALGLGLVINHITNLDINYNVPGSGFLLNRGKGWGVGGEFGFWWMINKNNFLEGSYFSPFRETVRGDSIGSQNGTTIKTKLKYGSINYTPSTFILAYTHIFCPKFLASVKLAYSLWDSDRNFVLKNVAAGPNPTVFILNWRNTFFFSLFARYQVLEKFALFSALSFDQSLVHATNNLVGFPIGDVYSALLGGEYRFNKMVAFQSFLGVGLTSSRINNPPGVAFGKNKARFSFFGAGLVIDF